MDARSRRRRRSYTWSLPRGAGRAPDGPDRQSAAPSPSVCSTEMPDSATPPATATAGAVSLRRRRALGAILAALPLAAACGGGSEAGPNAGKQRHGDGDERASDRSADSAPANADGPAADPHARAPLSVHRAVGGRPGHRAPADRGGQDRQRAAARPQFGLGYADLVYEMLAEGELTRFMAMYLEGQPETVGPVRSARRRTSTSARSGTSCWPTPGPGGRCPGCSASP